MIQILSMRNGLLLLAALRKERLREVYVCVNGFETFEQKYPFLCKFKTSLLFPPP